MRQECCETCRFWEPVRDAIRDESLTLADGGYCHRYPPTQEHDTDCPPWPELSSYDWCGEYQPSAPSGDEPVSSLRLSVRARKVLERAGVRTIAELTDTTPAEIVCWRNAGETTLDEIRAVLAERGLGLAEPSRNP